MKASSWIWVVTVALGFGSPSCGGTSDGGSGKAAGGQGGEAGAGSGAGPATHASECEALCERTTDAGCTTETDGTSCLLLCATVTGYSGCQPQITQWLDCANDATVSCAEDGTPTFEGCDASLLLVTACAMSADPPKVVARSCSEYCETVSDAGCSLESGYGDCEQMCGATGMVVAVCQDTFVNWVRCQSQTSITCAEDGTPEVTGCESQELLYMGCVMTEVGQGTLPAESTASAGGASAN
jgi:hypothetical protein